MGCLVFFDNNSKIESFATILEQKPKIYKKYENVTQKYKFCTKPQK